MTDPGPVAALPGPREAWLPRPYQQLLRGPTLRWWHPVLSLVVLLAGLAVVFAAVVVVGVVSQLVGGGLLTGADEVGWAASPGGMLATNLLLASLIPVSAMAVWAGFGWRPRWLGSVTGGIRWGWLAVCSGVAGIALLLPSLGLTLATQDVTRWTPEPRWPALTAVVLLTTPLQAAGEEYLFRGWLPQTIGAVFASPRLGAVVGGGVATALFALAHGQQDPWLFADRFAFGVIASWLVWRTGGLEAGIAVHAANNLVAFGFTIADGGLVDSLTVTRAGAGEVVVDVVTLLVTAAVILAVARRRRVVRLFVPPPVFWGAR